MTNLSGLEAKGVAMMSVIVPKKDTLIEDWFVVLEIERRGHFEEFQDWMFFCLVIVVMQ